MIMNFSDYSKALNSLQDIPESGGTRRNAGSPSTPDKVRHHWQHGWT
jgi:hypothetical protein